MPLTNSPSANPAVQAQGPARDLALHTLGWKAFQDLCAQICEEVLKQNVSIYREAQDGGQDAVLLIRSDQSKKRGHTGTVQCKFTSDSKRRLKPSDLAEEKKSICELVANQQAYSYYFMTNMSVDAPVAAEIREQLRALGVIEVEVFGREWITMKIRESARLRALVPRVYGLGDLSIILDERRAEQTRALLGHLLPTLGVYVPTAAHRQAVRVLGEYGIVLLLGAPATGKSMLAAILATTALDGDNHRCFQVDGPTELLESWNPHEPGSFYWIDDAFGPNQLRDDYVDQWIAMMNKLKAAISAGNRFVLTSRSHIWLAAKNKLATRNHPRFANGSAIVDVGALSPEERSQVLYNHIKAGTQSAEWKLQVKPYLAEVAREPNLLPEIARRLGDKSYTAGINRLPDDLKRFVAEPLEFLKDTIGELSDAHRAALTIVFLHRSRLPDNLRDDERWALVGDKFGVSQVEIGDALNQLNGSFLIQKSNSSGKTWSFFHPTIADALSAILGQRPDLVELYVRGTRVEALLSEAVCAGAETIRDAVVVPDSINDLLISRLLEIPDEQGLNRKLFAFLAERASEAVLRGVLKQNQSLLSRQANSNWQLSGDPTIRLYARVQTLGQLPAELRSKAVDRLEQAIVNNLDGSFLDEDDILALFPPTKLLSLSVQISGEFLDLLPDRITGIADEADPDIDPEGTLEDMRSFVGTIKGVFSDSTQVQERIADIERTLSTATKKVSEKKRDFSDQWIGQDVTPGKVTSPTGGRPLFSDVDT
jgi:hypothetical protein